MEQTPPMTPAHPPLVLASSSPTRQAQLRRLGIDFTVAPPRIDERPLPGEAPEALVMRLSEAKAEKVASTLDRGLVIGSDQVGLLGDRIMGKPGGHAAAVEQLLAASGSTLRFLSGVCLLDAGSGRRQADLVETTVRFRPLDRAMVEAYVLLDRPYECAGGFKSESMGVALIDGMSSDDPSAILGLPLIRLVRMLENEGIEVLRHG